MNLLGKDILVLDGGLGTTLEDEHHIKLDGRTPLWSSHTLVEGVSTLRTVQQDFARAGADIIMTATYQASFHGFANTKTTRPGGIEKDEAKRLMLSAVTIAREAFSDRKGLVALSLGAYGATMVPGAEYSGLYGSMGEAELYEFHLDRLNVFVKSEEWNHVDLVAFETLPRLDEVRATRRVMQDVKGKGYWIACVFPNDDARLPDGTDIDTLVRTMLEGEDRPFAIGINCTKIHKISALILAFERAAKSQGFDLPKLVLYPDAAGGKVYDTKSWQWVGNDEDEAPWGERVSQIVSDVRKRAAWQGIIVGGCCKASPQHINKLRSCLDSHVE